MASVLRTESVANYLSSFYGEEIRPKTVYYHAYRTRIMSGNPLAIFMELLSRPEFADWQHVWVYGSEKALANDTFKRYADLPNVSYVRSNSPEHMRALATCEYLITNAALPDYWQKREGQVVINTWHGTPLKTLGKHARDFNPNAIANAQRNFLLSDYLVMPNAYTAERMVDSYSVRGISKAKILDVGYPRCDLVLKTDRKRIVGLLESACGHSLADKRILLYAPTFRSEGGRSQDSSKIMSEYMQQLSDGLPDDCELFFKVHNTLGAFFEGNRKMKGHLIFDEIETNELLAATDILITDYSSIFFDYIATDRPVLFFDFDRDEYVHRHGMYLDMSVLPGVECPTVEEVLEQVDKVRAGTFSNNNVEYARKTFAYNDDGKASQRVVDAIFCKDESEAVFFDNEIDEHDSRNSVLIAMGNDAKLSSSFILFDLLRDLDPSTHRITICAPKVDIIWREAEAINPQIKILYSNVQIESSAEKYKNHKSFYRDTYEKYFPGMRFDSYYNLKATEDALDKLLLALFPSMERRWLFNWSSSLDTSKIAKLATRYVESRAFCYESELVPQELCEAGVTLVDRKQMLDDPNRRMTVLICALYDSMNYPMAVLAKELESRGHRVLVVSQNPHDEINNEVFTSRDIQVFSLGSLEAQTLDFVDCIVGAPVLAKKFRRVYAAARERNILVFSFASLFSSIVMRIMPDFVLSLGAAKEEELSRSNLHYSCVAIGNPQYDKLVSCRREEARPIRKVLVVEQGGYPYGEKGKRQLADMLIRIATENPTMEFTVKPRYLPNMEGATTHNVSEHVYDYLTDIPDNLILLRHSTVLEDIVPSFDAMLTLWSTAYLDALMVNMPLLLVDGFDSDDVFDVRTQRVRDAYKHLAKTGCLRSYKDLGDLTDSFRLVDEGYAEHEVYHRKTPSAPRVADVIELCYERLVKPNVRPATMLSCGAESFEEELDKVKLIDASSDESKLRKQYLNTVNALLQEFAYVNRCMGEVLDLSSLEWYYEAPLPDEFPDDLTEYLRGVRLDMQTDFYAIETDYFTSLDGARMLETDGILQNYYFELAYKLGAIERLERPPFEVLSADSQHYYLSLAYLDRHRLNRAYEHLMLFLQAGTSKSVVNLVEHRRIHSSVGPFKNNLVRMLAYNLMLLKSEDTTIIDYLYRDQVHKNLLGSWQKVQILWHKGDYEEALSLVRQALNWYDMHPAKKKTLVGRAGSKAIRVWLAEEGKILLRMAERAE